MTLAAEYQNIPDVQMQFHAAHLERQHKFKHARALHAQKLAEKEKKEKLLKAYCEAGKRSGQVRPVVKDESPLRKRFRERWTKMVELAIAEKMGVQGLVVIPPPQPTFMKIITQVCEKHGIEIPELKSARRDRKVVLARCEAAYRCRKETSLSLPRIGRFMGGRDHTTILNQFRQWERLLKVKAGDKSLSRPFDYHVDWSLVE